MKHSRLLLFALVAGSSLYAGDVDYKARQLLLEQLEAAAERAVPEEAIMYAEIALSEHAHPDLINTLRQQADLPPLSSEEYEVAKTEFDRLFPHM